MAAHENMSSRTQDISHRVFDHIIEFVDPENIYVDTYFLIIG